MREAALEAKNRTWAKAKGWFVEKIMKTGRRGFPDRFYARAHKDDVCRCCGRGRVVLIEWKRKGCRGGLTELQEIRITELRAAGVEVHVVDDLDDAMKILSSDL